MLNFKDIKENFFINYSKYWIGFFILLIIYFLNSYRSYHFQTNKIPRNIENSVYIGSGIVINKNNVIVNKELLDQACIGQYSGLKGNIFAIDKKHTIQVVPLESNSILNITVLGTKRNEDTFDAYALFDINDSNDNINGKIIVPKTLNRGGYFDFNNGRFFKADNSPNFFVSVKNTSAKDALLGMPVFNKNYILLGIIKSISENILNESKRDKLLNNSSVQKTYFVNGVENIKKFLDSKNISYFMASRDFYFGREKYNIENSLVNIICIDRY